MANTITVTWHDWTYSIEGSRGAGYEVTRHDNRSDEASVTVVGRASSRAAAVRLMRDNQRTLAALNFAPDLA